VGVKRKVTDLQAPPTPRRDPEAEKMAHGGAGNRDPGLPRFAREVNIDNLGSRIVSIVYGPEPAIRPYQFFDATLFVAVFLMVVMRRQR
jgi:hypothetical protein